MKMTMIVPTYNLGDYFASFAASVVAQTHPVQLWLIDDASTDDTATQVRHFAAGHGDWVHAVIRRQHGGPGAARNVGLTHATGDAVIFVDGDDLLAPEFVGSLAAGFDWDVQATAVGYSWWGPAQHTSRKWQVLSQRETFAQVATHGTPVGGYVWNKAFLLSELRRQHLKFEENLALAEDYLFTASYVAHARGNYAFLPTTLYTKRNRPNSTIHSVGFRGRAQEGEVFDRIRRLGEEI